MNICRLCDSKNIKATYQASEKMFGTGEAFEYFECSDCGSVQISQIPADLGKHYPNDYYSLMSAPQIKEPSSANKMKYKFLSPLKVPARSKLGKALGMKEFYNWLGRAHVKPTDSIVDFGSGAGHLLLEMYQAGFQDLTGIDPFLSNDIIYNDHVRVLKKEPTNLEKKYDAVMSHHSFEHVTDPRKTFSQLVELLKPGGVLILRVPYLGWAWRHFGADWVSFDAPRHLYHFSQKAILKMAAENKVLLEDLFFDSFENQHWASLQYQKGISLFDPKSYGQNPGLSIFSKKQIQQFKKDSQRLNQQQQGDQVCYILRKSVV